jgi:hypothetical protein
VYCACVKPEMPLAPILRMRGPEPSAGTFVLHMRGSKLLFERAIHVVMYLLLIGITNLHTSDTTNQFTHKILDSATLQSTQWIINAAYDQRALQLMPLSIA